MTAPAFPARSAVTVFCGGRGSATLARELVTRADVRLSLVVNGYDNGASTGALRAFVPGMLGASDFRKNVRHHLDPADPHQAALLRVLDHRLPDGAGPRDLSAALAALREGRVPGDRPGLAANVPRSARTTLVRDLEVFERYRAARGGGLDLADCSLANLVLAGTYLRTGCDFNRALASFCAVFGSPARILNATDGTNAFLVALKEDGELLADEADIVRPQSGSPIRHLFLLPRPLDGVDRAALAALPPDERVARLRARSTTVPTNPAAARAVLDADLLVFGPGTPHSSLLPTYLTRGLGEHVRAGRARAKVFLVNIREDHDARHLDARDLLDRTLAALGDPDNSGGSITHVLHHHRRRPAVDAPAVPAPIGATGRYRGTRWIAADLEHEVHTGVHSGRRTAAVLAAVLRGTALDRTALVERAERA